MNIMQHIRIRLQNGRAQQLASKYHIGDGYKRIYLYHIRKTGGTSLNNMFLAVSGEDSQALYKKLSTSKPTRVITGDNVFVGWDKRMIEEGNYLYAFSHIPAHQLDLPPQTFTFTCLRDPIKRIISHYRMLMEYKVNKIDRPVMLVEGLWLGDSFNDFLDKIPQEHLLNQLYMFSSNYNVDEAYERITACSHWIFTEYFSDGVSKLAEKLQFPLNTIHIRKTTIDVEIKPQAINRLREMLAPEYELYERLKVLSKSQM